MSVNVIHNSQLITDFDETQLVDVFADIGLKSMQDMPVYNNAISTYATKFEKFDEYWVGTLVTPWFLNLMAFPATTKALEQLSQSKVGAKYYLALPSGRFEFIKGHYEALGDYYACSLLSPVFELTDQSHAEATTKLTLESIMTCEEPDKASRAEMSIAPSQPNGKTVKEEPISRRDFITGFRTRRQAQAPTNSVNLGSKHG